MIEKFSAPQSMSAAKPAASTPLSLRAVSASVVQVHWANGLLVGHLKKIGTVWKFKALGFDDGGAMVPGGGPLTERHNTVFETLDEDRLHALLAPEFR